MSETIKILALAGDGIGPEVVGAALAVLDHVARTEGLALEVEEDLLGGACWDRHGTFCRDETVEQARAADAVLVGAVGGPKWEGLEIEGGPEQKDGLTRLRKELDVFAGLRPARAYPALVDRVPLKPEVAECADVMVVRELCAGLYFGTPRGIERGPDGVLRGTDANLYTAPEIERIARTAFELARRRRGVLASVDKANVMESGMLWRRIVTELGAEAYPDVALTHYYADHAAYRLMREPRGFDVVLGDNLFGDILSDQAAVLAGSLGMLPSASLNRLAPPGVRSRPGIYEPVHGSAPDIAGRGVANPLGTILSLAMMFDHGLARPDIAQRIEDSVERVLSDGVLTPDLGGDAGTAEVTRATIAAYG